MTARHMAGGYRDFEWTKGNVIPGPEIQTVCVLYIYAELHASYILHMYVHVVLTGYSVEENYIKVFCFTPVPTQACKNAYDTHSTKCVLQTL